MTDLAEYRKTVPGRWRLVLWTFLAALLLLPAIAMPFTQEVRWTRSDFMAAIAILAAIGCAIELIARFVNRHVLRAALICGVIGAGLAIWAEGAVGIF